MLKLIKLEPEPSPFKLRKQMKIDVPVLGLAGSHGREMGGKLVQVRRLASQSVSPDQMGVFAGSGPKWSAATPCQFIKSIEKESQIRSFTSLQMVHTHRYVCIYVSTSYRHVSIGYPKQHVTYTVCSVSISLRSHPRMNTKRNLQKSARTEGAGAWSSGWHS